MLTTVFSTAEHLLPFLPHLPLVSWLTRYNSTLLHRLVGRKAARGLQPLAEFMSRLLSLRVERSFSGTHQDLRGLQTVLTGFFNISRVHCCVDSTGVWCAGCSDRKKDQQTEPNICERYLCCLPVCGAADSKSYYQATFVRCQGWTVVESSL